MKSGKNQALKNIFVGLLTLSAIMICGHVLADKALTDSTQVAANAGSSSANSGGLFADYPNLHPLVVHFPIVLLVFAAFMQIIAFWKKSLNLAVAILLAAGTAGAWLAAEIFDAHVVKGVSPEIKHIFHLHHQYADYTTWLATIALGIKLLSFLVRKQRILIDILAFGFMLASAVTVCVSGHYGSHLVHVEGVGPKGNLLR